MGKSLMDMAGRNCGSFSGDAAPDGYWLRDADAPDYLSRLEFLDRVGPTRFAGIFAAMVAQPALAFAVMRGFAAETVHIEASFPAVRQMEALGIVPAGTAVAIWS